MPKQSISRRDSLKTLGGALLAGVGGSKIVASPSAAVADDAKDDDSIVDVHLHLVSSRFTRGPISPPLTAPFDLLQQPGGHERLAKLVAAELRNANVGHVMCMPTTAVTDDDPLGIKRTLAQAALIEGVNFHPIGVAHPERFDRGHMRLVEEVLEQGGVKALKAYLGYYHYDAHSAGYRPYFKLAAKYDIPVILHTGDTNSQIAKVRYAHPLQMDEVAVDFPDTKFVLAHFGNPWIMDAAQVAYKNKNVWIDLSAILIGDADDFAKFEEDGVIARAVNRIKEGIEYTEDYERFLFGSDWPLAPIDAYADFVAKLFPSDQHDAVFRENAKSLFNL